MVKRIVASCDNTEAHGVDELVDASEVVLSLGGPPRGLDLCPDCRKALIGPLEGLVAEWGQPLGPDFQLPTRTPRGPYRPRVESAPGSRLGCPMPGCDYDAASKTNVSVMSISVFFGKARVFGM